MQLRTLGNTGIKVTPYCLGTMLFGPNGNEDRADCVRIIHRAIDAGINFIDTADVYGGGLSEVIIGEALQHHRGEVVLATKVNGQMGDNPNHAGNSRHWIITEVENSLRRLGTDYIDLYQIHHPDPTTDIEETLSALTSLLTSGKVRAIGSSNFPASEIVEAQWIAERRGLSRFRTEQPPYSILNRGAEKEVFPICEKYGIGTLVWSPLAMGMLTGKYRKGTHVDTPRLHWVPRHLTDEQTLDVVEELIGVAATADLSITAMAMAFTVAHPAVTAAIIGPRTVEQLDGLLTAAGTALDDDVLDRIDQIAPPGSDIGQLDVAYRTPAQRNPQLRRRPHGSRSAA